MKIVDHKKPVSRKKRLWGLPALTLSVVLFFSALYTSGLLMIMTLAAAAILFIFSILLLIFGLSLTVLVDILVNILSAT